MRIEHSFYIYAKLYMPTHHFEFYVSFFFLLCFSHLFGVMVCNVCHSSLRSVCPSAPAFPSTFHHRLPWYFIRWLESPTACGSQISKVIGQTSRSRRPKKPSETGPIQGFRVFSGERMGERPEIPYAAVSWPPNYILITVCWFTNFGGILTQWNISNVLFPYLMENAWQ